MENAESPQIQFHGRSGTKMRRSACPQLAPPPPRRRLHRLQATPVVRCAESSCTLPAAPPCAVGVRAAVTTFCGGHNNKFADWCKSSPPSTWTPASLIHIHTNTFGPCAFGPCAFGPRAFKHQHFRPLRLRPLRLGPSCSPGARLRWRTGMTSQCTKNHTTSVSCRVIVDTSARVWALLNNVGRKGNIGCVLPGVDGLVV